MPSRSGCCVEEAGRRDRGPGDGEVALDDRVVGQAGVTERVPPADHPVHAGGHVERAGDGPDAPAAAVDHPLGGDAPAGDVVDVDVAQAAREHRVGLEEAAHEDGGQHGRPELRLEVVAAVVRRHDDAVHVAAAQVAANPPALLARPGEQQHELEVGPGQPLADAREGAAEERVGEDALVRLGHHEGYRVGPPGHEGPGGAVRCVPEAGDGVVDRRLRLGGDSQATVDGARRGRPGYPGRLGHVIQGGWA